VTKERFVELAEQVSRISRMISGLMQYLRDSGLRGPKYANATPAAAPKPTKNLEP
jgi:hypothetical protein